MEVRSQEKDVWEICICIYWDGVLGRRLGDVLLLRSVSCGSRI